MVVDSVRLIAITSHTEAAISSRLRRRKEEHGVRPVHESMNSAELLKQRYVRPQQQTISACQYDLRAAVDQILSARRPY
jgi:hypothetical protein